MPEFPPALYDPIAPDFQGRHAEVYRALRDLHPVYREPRTGFYVLSRHADVWEASADWATFSSVTEEAGYHKPMMVDLDPPAHSLIRRVVSQAFTPRRVAALEDAITAKVHTLIGAFVERGTCDLMAEFAAVLPSDVVGELLGVPEDVRPGLREHTEQLMRMTVPHDGKAVAERVYAVFEDLLAERRRRPADDMMTMLIAAEVDGRRLTQDELLGFCFLLLVGGNDTTTNLIGNGIRLLDTHRDVRAELVAGPELIDAAIEEILRLEPPTLTSGRQTTRDVELHGTTIPAGSRVQLLWGSANRDEREYPDPERLDIRRRPRHTAFGHGPHFCLGAPLARLEARIAFRELLGAIPDYTVVGEPRHVRSSWARGFTSLPLAFTPRSAAEPGGVAEAPAS
ncbi:cytochrome P450 [Uniformispora flossi]|uniref:cytochrome P450 n=1 Tax=Uniformispora flossi TaxID=3390723 RepID=UPI003C2B0FC7